MKKQYQWHEKSISSYYAEKVSGKIVGQYSKVSFSDDVYHALVNGDTLGSYISHKHAKEAIEKQVAKNDQDEIEMKKAHPHLYDGIK